MPVAFALSISPPDLMKGNWPIDKLQDAMNISSWCVWEGVGVCVFGSGLCSMS